MRRTTAAAALVFAGLLAGCTGGATGGATGAVPAAPTSTPPAPASAATTPSPTSTAPTPTPSPTSAPPTSTTASATAPSESGTLTATQTPTATAKPTPAASAKPTASKKPAKTKKPATPPPPDDRPAVALPANPIGISPLTGRPIGAKKPVLVMKLDNTPNAQPHAGLIDADVVYIEEVEYGITRLAAVFSSSVPKRIGPVRSARITDIDLFAQYGKPAFGYSGAQRKMWPFIKAASLFDVSPYTSYTGYSRDNGRRAPYNLFFNGKAGIQRAPRATVARDMGFVFSETPPPGGLIATKARMAWGYAQAGFDYVKKDNEYRVLLNGSPARAEEWSGGQRAATVVIQYVKQTKSQFWDKGGGNTPHAATIGSGTALVLRDGRVWKTTWSRPNAKSGTTFTLRDGSLMTFAPGQQWIVLLDRKRKATVTPMTKPKPTAKPTPSPTETAQPTTSETPAPPPASTSVPSEQPQAPTQPTE